MRPARLFCFVSLGLLSWTLACTTVRAGEGAQTQASTTPPLSNRQAAGLSTDCDRDVWVDGFLNEQPIPDTFSVLSWNIEKGADAGWIADLAQIAAAEHVLLIQEAVLDPNTGALPLSRDFTSWQYFAAGYRQGSTQTGVLTASPWVASHHCALTAWEPWLGTPKATSVTQYALSDTQETLVVVNVHAVNFSFGTADFEEQFREIGQVLRRTMKECVWIGLSSWI